MNVLKQLKKAKEYSENNELNKAEKVLNNVIKHDQNNIEALMNLGRICFIQNNYLKAEYYLEKVYKIAQTPILLNNLLNIKLKLNKKEHALEIINKLILIYPADIQLSIARAQLLRDLGRSDEAIKILEKLSEENKNNINILISLGFTLNKIQEYKKAISVYQKALKIDSNNFAAIYNCGITYLNEKNDIKKAIEYLEKGLQIEKENVNLNLTLVAAYEQLREFNKAQKIIKNLKIKYPKSSKVYFQSASVLIHMEKLDDALVDVNQAIELDNENYEAKYTKASILLKKKQFEEGMDFYRWRVRKQNLFTKFDDININSLNRNEKLLIYFEQGLGDQILYSRFIDSINEKVEKCVVVLQEKIVNFISSNFKNIKIIAQKNYRETDYIGYKKINLASSARLVTDFENIINKPKLFKINNFVKKNMEIKYRKKKIIGISWKSENKDIGQNKSINLNEIIKNINFPKEHEIINLQYGNVKKEIELIEKKILIDEDINLYDDIDGLAGLIHQCEFVITTSNITAHISGAIGKKTYLLVPNGMGLFWYWSKGLKVYPSINIYRQDADGTWDSAFKLINKKIVE